MNSNKKTNQSHNATEFEELSTKNETGEPIPDMVTTEEEL
jgi:hypothetical protein